MKIAIMPCISAKRGLEILLGCLLLCLLACVPAASQDENITRIGGNFYDYAEFSFAVPKELEDMVEAESLSENDYAEGRYVAASLLFNDSRVWILLLYPCDAPEGDLDAAGLKSAVEGYSPGLNQTVYSPDLLNISDRSAIAGQFNNQILIAYQPSVQTVSMIFIDVNVTADFLEYFPQSLMIIVNESSSLLWPGYCDGAPEPEAVSAQTASEPAQTTQTEQTQAGQTESVPGKEQVAAEVEAIKEKFDSRFGIGLSF